MTEYYVGVTQSSIGRVFTFIGFALTNHQVVLVERQLIGKLHTVSIAVTDGHVITHPYKDGTNEVVSDALSDVLGGKIKLMKH